MYYLRLLIIFCTTGFVAFGAGIVFGFSLADDYSIMRPATTIAMAAGNYAEDFYSLIRKNNFINSQFESSIKSIAPVYAVMDEPVQSETCRRLPVTTPTISLIDYLIGESIDHSLENRINLAEKYKLIGYDASAESNQKLLILITGSKNNTYNNFEADCPEIK